MKTKKLDECDESKSIFASAACRRHHPFSKTTPFADISERVESTADLKFDERCVWDWCNLFRVDEFVER
jgi:hypothetical protein